MRSKEEQLKRSFEIINEQAKELVEVYGWNKDHVKELESSLKQHAEEEVESFGGFEDISGCWQLVSWNSDFKTQLIHNFKELEDIDSKRYIEFKGLVYELVDKFKYIENIKLNRLDFIAEYKDGKGIFGSKVKNEKYLIWDLNIIKNGIDTKGFMKVANKIYSEVLEKNKEID